MRVGRTKGSLLRLIKIDVKTKKQAVGGDGGKESKKEWEVMGEKT